MKNLKNNYKIVNCTIAFLSFCFNHRCCYIFAGQYAKPRLQSQPIPRLSMVQSCTANTGHPAYPADRPQDRNSDKPPSPNLLPENGILCRKSLPDISGSADIFE